MKNLLPTLLIISPLLLASQSDTTGQHRLIRGLMDYRNELIVRNPEGYKKMYLLDELWKVEEKEAINDMLSGVTYANKYHGVSAQTIINMALIVSMDTFKYRHLLTVDVVQAIIENDDLALIVGEGILKPKPPFLINPETSLYDELGFYKIDDGMRIAEIGAGTGMFSLMLGLAYDSLAIFMNDIALNAMNFAYDRINRCQSVNRSNVYFAVQGHKKSTELEAYKVDKVIVRNSFHHFSHKSKMLASIRKSIYPNGDLYITDPEQVPNKKGICPKALPIEELREVLLENGFQIVVEKHLEKWNWVMLHCKPTQGN